MSYDINYDLLPFGRSSNRRFIVLVSDRSPEGPDKGPNCPRRCWKPKRQEMSDCSRTCCGRRTHKFLSLPDAMTAPKQWSSKIRGASHLVSLDLGGWAC